MKDLPLTITEPHRAPRRRHLFHKMIFTPARHEINSTLARVASVPNGYTLRLRNLFSPSLRSLNFELKRVGFAPSCLYSTGHDGATACAKHASPPRFCKSASNEGTHQTSGHIDNGALTLALTPTATLGVIAGSLAGPIRAQISPRHTSVVDAGRGVGCGSEKTHGILLRAAPVCQQVCSSTSGVNSDHTTASFGDGFVVPAMNPGSARVDAGLTRTSPRQGVALEAGFLATGSAHTAGSEDLVDGLANASIIFDGGVQGDCGALGRAGDVGAGGSLAEGGGGCPGEERQMGVIHVTDQDFRDVAEALMK